MTRYTVFGKASKCPNCHAYLAGQAGAASGLIRCEYCGVEVMVEQPKRALSAPPVDSPPVVLRPPEPTQLVRAPRVRTWPYFLLAPAMTGGILYYSYFMQKQAVDRTTRISQTAQAHAAEVQREAQARAAAAIDGANEPRETKPRVDAVCHLSAMELQQTIETESKVVAACFEDAPKKVKKVEADVKLVVQPNGAVADVDIDWDGWKPTAWMRKCATRKIRGWKLARPSGELATRCEVRLSVAPR